MISHKICLFRNAMDATPKGWEGSWTALQQLLDRTEPPSLSLPLSDAKKAHPALSGAEFRPGSRRARANVVGISVLLGDVDNAREVPTGEYHMGPDGRPTDRPVTKKECLLLPVLPEQVLDVFRQRGISAYLYTTWSHSGAWPRFRFVVPLARAVPPDLWPEATEWALTNLGLNQFRRGLDLPVLRDTARIHFLPGSPYGAVQRWVFNGQALSIPVEGLKRAQPVPNLWAPWQMRILFGRSFDVGWEHRFGVDLRTLDLAGLLASRGITVGEARPYGGGLKWRCHCPWASEHSHGADDDAAVIFHETGRYPVWRCAHSHHSHMGLRDILEWAGGVA